jgi:hypothetical protein
MGLKVQPDGIFHKKCSVNGKHNNDLTQHRGRLKWWVSTVKGPSQVDMLFWEEMSRREAWDREFENNTPNCPEDKSIMERLKEEETCLRQEWDLKFRQPRPPTTQQNVASG